MKIGKLLKIYLDMNEIGYREVAKEIGISHSTIARIIAGRHVTFANALKLMVWMCQ